LAWFRRSSWPVAARRLSPRTGRGFEVRTVLRDGKKLWQKTLRATETEDPFQGNLRDHGYATSIPVADGQRVFVFFGKSGVLAFDWEGNQLWQKGVGTGSAIMGWGSGTSLVLCKDLVIVNANAES
jgi:hypothetical protein